MEAVLALKKELEDDKKEREEAKKTHSFEETFSKQAKGLDDADKKYVKATLKIDASEDDIKKAVSDYKAMLAKRGFKGFGTDGTSKKTTGESDDDLEKSVKRMLDKKNKK